MAAVDRQADPIQTCPCCGLAQTLPPITPKQRACCARCGTTLLRPTARYRTASRTAAVATAALLIYPFAVTMPIMRVEQLGFHNDASILDGVTTLLAQRQLFVGIVVLLCSVVLPVAKLLGLLVLSAGGLSMRHHHRAWTYRFIEFTGRWGMLDVLAVAVLVAVVKLGTSVELTLGPGAAAFAVVVIMSLIATAVFDPHSLWENEPFTDADAPAEAATP